MLLLQEVSRSAGGDSCRRALDGNQLTTGAELKLYLVTQ